MQIFHFSKQCTDENCNFIYIDTEIVKLVNTNTTLEVRRSLRLTYLITEFYGCVMLLTVIGLSMI